MYRFSQLNNSLEEIKATSELLHLVFSSKKFSVEYLNWQYNENPDGKAVGLNAYSENGKLAGHYVTQPMQAMLSGKVKKGLLSLNTATHLNHQGKGLFTELAKKTYDYAHELGYEFVIGVANQNSTHGFIKKLGFQLVGKLNAVLGMGNVTENCFYPHENTFSQYDFVRVWNKSLLKWRISNPGNKYHIRKTRNYFEIISKTDSAFIKAVIGSFSSDIFPASSFETPASKPITLLIGTDLATKSAFYFNIPNLLRPSPLNLIFKDLTGKNKNIGFDKTFFSAIDFDAY